MHLPSPETIKLLGHYLGDDRDFEPPRISGSDYISRNPANAHFACGCLRMIGLRGAGLGPERDFLSVMDEELAKARAWWEEVKAGNRAFSFKGQAVEYRFTPDGTWTSTPIANPPDDGPKPPAPQPPTTSAPDKSLGAATTKTNQPALWPWVGGVILVVLGILIWRIKARCGRKSP